MTNGRKFVTNGIAMFRIKMIVLLQLAKNRHYANVQLIEGVTGQVLVSSGRKWGKNTVSVDTGYCTTYSCLVVDSYLQYAAIWYGF